MENEVWLQKHATIVVCCQDAIIWLNCHRFRNSFKLHYPALVYSVLLILAKFPQVSELLVFYSGVGQVLLYHTPIVNGWLQPQDIVD